MGDGVMERRRSISEARLDGKFGLMRYRESAPRQGVPVLLVHGYGALIEHWRAVMRPIAGRHTMFALDLYHFGYSARPTLRIAPPSKQLWADQLAEFVAEVIREPTVVVGHSMGGLISAHFAACYPHLLRGLVLIDSTGLLPPGRQPSPIDQGLFGLAQAPGLGELLAGMAANPWLVRQGLLNAYYRKERVDDELVRLFSGPLRRTGGAAPYLATTRAFERLFLNIEPGKITAPALLIWGDKDKSVPPSLAAHFKQSFLPQAEIAILPESGHCPFDETPRAFNDTLLSWLDRV